MSLKSIAALPAKISTAWGLYQNPRRAQADVSAFRDQRFRHLIHFAYHNVVFYRDWLDAASVRPDDICGVGDIAALPLLSKRDLRDAPLESRLACGSDRAKLISHNTSGSTGEPFTIYRSHGEENLLQLLRLRAAWQYGFRFFDQRADLTMPFTSRSADPIRRAAKASGLTPVTAVNTRQDPDELLRALARIQPDVITGYPGVIAQAARRLPERPDVRIRPRFVVTGGEPLTALMREQIESGFGVPVYEMYGLNEFNLVAWQCPRGRHLHVCDDAVVVEILRDGKPVREGEEGEVVVTGLFSKTMPFIRYRTGDLAVRGGEYCSCGQPFSTLGGIQGRTADYVRLPDGRLVHPFVITEPLVDYDNAWIDQHQLVQTAPDRVVLRVKTRVVPSAEERARLIAAGEKVTRPARFELEFVERFEPHPSGKFRSYLGLADG